MAQECINCDKSLSILNEQFNKNSQSNWFTIYKPKIFVCNVDEKSIQGGNEYTKNFINKYSEEIL